MITQFKTLYTSFEGRISRKSFWLGLLGIIIASFIGIFVLGMFFWLIGRTLVYVSMAISLILLVPMAAVTVKRLHDNDKPAMPWLLIFFGPGFISNMMRDFGIDYSVLTLGGEQVLYPGKIAMVISLIGLVTGLWALYELGIRKGTAGENTYGPDPLAVD